MKVTRLIQDLSDGIVMCNLTEILTGQEIKFDTTIRVPTQKIENLSACFAVLQAQGVSTRGCNPEGIHKS
jgi:hypothetical protein